MEQITEKYLTVEEIEEEIKENKKEEEIVIKEVPNTKDTKQEQAKTVDIKQEQVKSVVVDKPMYDDNSLALTTNFEEIVKTKDLKETKEIPVVENADPLQLKDEVRQLEMEYNLLSKKTTDNKETAKELKTKIKMLKEDKATQELNARRLAPDSLEERDRIQNLANNVGKRITVPYKGLTDTQFLIERASVMEMAANKYKNFAFVLADTYINMTKIIDQFPNMKGNSSKLEKLRGEIAECFREILIEEGMKGFGVANLIGPWAKLGLITASTSMGTYLDNGGKIPGLDRVIAKYQQPSNTSDSKQEKKV